MKIINKNLILIFLAITMLFLGVQKVKADTCSAIPANGCDAANSQRTCYCSNNSASTDTSKNTIANLSAKSVCCSQFLPACTQACTGAGYVSRVLVDTSYPLNSVYNALSNISDQQMPTTVSTSPVSGGAADNSIPGVKGPTGIVPCGQTGGQMCTLCDLIKGFNTVIQYIMKIAIGVALLALAIGGIMYVVSAGDTGAIETAKTTIKNAAIGFVIIFAAYLIVNTTITYLGANPTLGMKTTTTWGQFDCTATNK